MAYNSTNMGLRVWDSPTDVFDYTNLKQNFENIDTHDHSSGKGALISANGLAAGAVTTVKIGDGQVTKIKTATEVAESAFSIWKPILQRSTVVQYTSDVYTTEYGTAYIMGMGGKIAAGSTIPVGGIDEPNALATIATRLDHYPSLFYIDPAQYAAESRSTEFRIRASILGASGSSATGTIVVNLKPVTPVWSVATSAFSLTLGSAIGTGSTYTKSSGSTTFSTSVSSNEIASSSISAGHYAFEVTNNIISGASINATLEYRQV